MNTKFNRLEDEGILREGEILEEDNPDSKEIENDDDTLPQEGEDKGHITPTPNEDDSSIPFHKHPRFKQVIEDNKQLKQTIEDLEETVKALSTKEPIKDDSIVIPQEFVDLFGENVEIYKRWQLLSQKQKEDAKREILDEIKKQKEEEIKRQKEESDALEKGKEYVENSLKELESKYSFDRNELIKFMIDFEKDYSPIVNSEGNYDFEKGYNLMIKMKGVPQTKKDVDAKKQLADTSIKKNTGVDLKQNTTINSKDLRNKSFTTLALED